VAPDERIRLFCGLRLPDTALERLSDWQTLHLGALEAPAARPVPRGNLHVTLAFLGSRPAEELPRIARELRLAAAAASPIRLRARRYRETRSVGMVVMDDLDDTGAALADDLGAGLERLGVYRREKRPWLPHITVLRFRERPRLSLPAPDLGEFSPSDAAVYSSVLRSGGAQYEALETVALSVRARRSVDA
jgi:2'-5' RNA ligase